MKLKENTQEEDQDGSNRSGKKLQRKEGQEKELWVQRTNS